MWSAVGRTTVNVRPTPQIVMRPKGTFAVDLELAVTSATSKARVIEALVAAGYRTVSGHVRLAYPFTVTVEGLDPDDRDAVVTLSRSVDPGVGVIVGPVPVPAPA